MFGVAIATTLIFKGNRKDKLKEYKNNILINIY